MIFDRNQTEFENCIQQKIWELGTRQLPLELTLPFVDTLKSACENYYNFNQSLLSDMYENPNRFGFQIDSLKQDWENAKQVEFYFWLLSKLTNLIGNEYEMPVDSFRKVIKKFNPISIEALKAHGFTFEEKSGIVVIRNDIYPDMFVAAKAVWDAGYTHYKVNQGYFMMNCDFRALAQYKRTYEDLHIVLSDKNRRIAEMIHEYCVNNKIMPQKCNYFYRVEYKHKGKIVYISDLMEKNQLRINIGFAEIGGEAFKMLENEIEKYNDAAEFKDFWRNNIKKCTNCRGECGKRDNPMKVLGKKTIVCQSYIRIYNPKEQDLKNIYRLIDLRTMVIKAGISEVFYPGNG